MAETKRQRNWGERRLCTRQKNKSWLILLSIPIPLVLVLLEIQGLSIQVVIVVTSNLPVDYGRRKERMRNVYSMATMDFHSSRQAHMKNTDSFFPRGSAHKHQRTRWRIKGRKEKKVEKIFIFIYICKAAIIRVVLQQQQHKNI